MKKIFLLLLLTTGANTLLIAQKRVSNGFILDVASGISYTDNIGSASTIGVEKIFKNALHSIQIDMLYVNQNFNTPYDNVKVKSQSIELVAYYSYNVYSNRYLTANLNIGGFVGYRFNHSPNQGYYLQKTDYLSSGVAIAAQVNFPINNKLGVFIEPTAMYNFSIAEKMRFSTQLGIRVKL